MLIADGACAVTDGKHGIFVILFDIEVKACFVAFFAAERFKHLVRHVPLFGSVAKSRTAYKATVKKDALASSVGILLVPGAGNRIRILRILRRLEKVALFGKSRLDKGGNRRFKRAKIVDNKIFDVFAVIDKLGPDKRAVAVKPYVRHVGIDLVFPFKLIAERIVAVIAVGFPRMIRTRKRHVRHSYIKARNGGGNTQVKPCAVNFAVVYDAGYAGVFLAVRSPFREIIKHRFHIDKRLQFSLNNKIIQDNENQVNQTK